MIESQRHGFGHGGGIFGGNFFLIFLIFIIFFGFSGFGFGFFEE